MNPFIVHTETSKRVTVTCPPLNGWNNNTKINSENKPTLSGHSIERPPPFNILVPAPVQFPLQLCLITP